MEFICSTCSVDNVRMIFGNGTMGYLGKRDNQYTWTGDLKTFSDAAELSHKCYNYAKNWTYIYYRVRETQWDEEPFFHKIHDPSNSADYLAIDPPTSPRFAFRNQLAVHCHNDRVVTALVTTSALIRGQVEWLNQMNSRTKGKSDIFVYFKRSNSDGESDEEVMVFSTPGNDNVSRIYLDNTQFHIIGLTEGDIADTNVTSFSNKLFFAGFSAFDIVSVRSPDAADILDSIEILPNRDFAIRFSSLPADRSALYPAAVTINKFTCGNVRWIGDELYALALPTLDKNFDLVVEFYAFPHVPKISKTVSLKRPSILSVVPNVTDIAPFTTLQFAVLYMGSTEFNDMIILIGNQRCEVQTAGVVPDFFGVTTFNCTVPFDTTGRKAIDVTSVGRKLATNFTLTYRQLSQNVTIAIDEGQETPIVLNCSAYANIFNDFEYRILETPLIPVGQLLFENKTELPFGKHIDVGDSLGRLRFRSLSHGRVSFQYYCADNATSFSPILATVVINIRPVIKCQNSVFTTGVFLLDERNTTLFKLE
ncbi:hypothetical protein BKA69DRAFT_1097856 [Paraphysoderma sedebokerense]|nr:hypothetical protein BKA69DRAFT_1097856 [Paraphysoderma sedebokerense]